MIAVNLSVAKATLPVQKPRTQPRMPTCNTRLWLDKYAPKSQVVMFLLVLIRQLTLLQAELCLHAKKLQEIRGWMERNIDLRWNDPAAQVCMPCLGNTTGLREHTQSLLILSGPPGCGKSTAVSLWHCIP